jgi:site-specific DNA recombinase
MDLLKPVTKLPTITIAFDYARLSRDRGKKSENISIQHRESRYFIEDQGWQHGGSRDDDDITASEFGTKTRDGYLALIQDIKNVPDQLDAEIRVVIVVTEMPRLYRQLEELLDLIKLCESIKLTGIWTTDGEGYDLSTPEGYHRAVGAVNNARLESKRASKRQLRKKKAQAAQGKYMGGQRRYGFEGAIKDEHGNIVNRDRINVAEVPEEIVHWVDWFNRLIAGEPQMSIVRDSNKRGIPSPQGCKWTVGNFRRLMTKEAYVIFDADGHSEDCPCLENPEGNGTLVHKSSNSRHRARWRGLITREQYELLLAAFQSTAQGHDHGMVHGRKYLLSGVAVCGGEYQGKPCGAAMYGNGRQLDNGEYQRRYRCRGIDGHGQHIACGRVFRDAIALEAFVTDEVLKRLDTPELARALAPTGDEDQAEALTRKIITQRKRRDLIKRQYARGDIDSLEDYKFMRAEADNAIEELEAARAKLRNTRAVNLLPADGNIREAWDKADITWRRAVTQLVVVRVIVKPGSPGGQLYKGRRFNPDDVVIEYHVLDDTAVAALSTLIKGMLPTAQRSSFALTA